MNRIDEDVSVGVERKLSKTKKFIFLYLGFIFLFLAIVGIAIPLLPTTPFLLLSAYFFARSSDRWHIWLLSHRYFGKIIRDYTEKRGVSLKLKVYALSLLWLTILSSALFFVKSLLIKVILFTIAAGVSYHILRLRTLK
ncbi:MAG: YbaN family protein [Ignavibacteria bacterium]|nr:YbaN family protein [Ignavibacteria bacterium]